MNLMKNGKSQFKLELRNINFTYTPGDSFVLNIENFSPGFCAAIMGENGSGKSTLGKLAAGILRPNLGQVLHNGQDISAKKLGEIGKDIGYLFQEPLIFASNPLEEIAFPLIFHGTPKEEAEDKARKLLTQFELTHITNHVTFTLSRGEKQRLAIAAAMVCQPSYFIMDEPTTGLDSRRRQILADTIKMLRSGGIGILLISHDEEFVNAIDADIYTMERGKLYA